MIVALQDDTVLHVHLASVKGVNLKYPRVSQMWHAAVAQLVSDASIFPRVKDIEKPA